MKLSNQLHAIVTGAASGMGACVAKHLAQEGVKMSVLDLHKQALESVAQELGALAIDCDVSDEKSLEHAFAAGIECHGNPHIVINCAGIAPAKRMVGKKGVMPLEDFKQVIDVNLVGTFNVMRLAANAMMQNAPSVNGERGIIINTASIAAFEGQIGQTAYSASKGGVVAMTLPAARELANHGIRVNAIAPGLILTPMLERMPQEVQDSLAQGVPFPKRFGRVDEFAALVLHLIDNEMINGEVIRLDGALRMQPK